MLISEHLELCYDDVLLKPSYSQVLPSEVSLKSKISKNTTLDIPLVTSAMDTVTHGPMAIAIAKLGGMGIIHKNYTPEEQAEQVKVVKAENYYSIFAK